jgi:transcriptional regulator with XRE-family HTH domain
VTTKTRRAVRRPGVATISGQLRDLIVARRLSPYAVALASDVAPSVMTRFVNGQRSLSLDTLDKVADALGLRLVEVGRRGKLQGRPAPATPALPAGPTEPPPDPDRSEATGTEAVLPSTAEEPGP